MLVNRDEFTCDECKKRIESFPKPRGWENPMTAETHVCSECWGKELTRAFAQDGDLTSAIKETKFPVRTLIGAVVKDGVVQKVIGKYGNVS